MGLFRHSGNSARQPCATIQNGMIHSVEKRLKAHEKKITNPQLSEWIIFSYVCFFSNAFYVCELPFYVFFFFYRLALYWILRVS